MLEEDPLGQLQDVHSLTVRVQEMQVSHTQLTAKVGKIDASIKEEILEFIDEVNMKNE